MRIQILGTRGHIPVRAPRYERHSGVLVDGSILLDLGETAYLRRRPRQIFITHLHPDHAVFVETKVSPPGDVYLPERSALVPDARIIRRPVNAGAHRVVPVPTEHSLKVRSLGFIVEHGGRRLFYSSDMISIHRRYHARLGRLDLVITDGSYMRHGGMVRVDPVTGKRFGHAGIPDLVEFFSRFSRRIVVTHFGSWFFDDIPGSRRRIASLGGGDVRVSAARDGQVIEV